MNEPWLQGWDDENDGSSTLSDLSLANPTIDPATLAKLRSALFRLGDTSSDTYRSQNVSPAVRLVTNAAMRAGWTTPFPPDGSARPFIDDTKLPPVGPSATLSGIPYRPKPAALAQLMTDGFPNAPDAMAGKMMALGRFNPSDPLVPTTPTNIFPYGASEASSAPRQSVLLNNGGGTPGANSLLIGASNFPPSTGGARALSPTEAYFAMDPVGRTLRGAYKETAELVPNMANAIKELSLYGYDVLGHGVNGLGNYLFDQNNQYQPAGSIDQAFQQDGVLPTLGTAVHGTVVNAPFIGTINSLYHRNHDQLGRSLVNSAIGGVGAFTANAYRTGSIGSGLIRGEGPFADLAGTLPPGYQRHHLNLDAVYRSAIPYSEGAAIGLRGDAMTGAGTPHYGFHRSMETFFEPYRTESELLNKQPTNSQYGDAQYQALLDIGLTPAEAMRLYKVAKENREAYGLMPESQIPRIPRKFNQTKGK